MNVSDSKSSFEQRLGQPLTHITPRDGVAAMCSFYAHDRIDGAAIENDRDMLLYQWGVDSFNAPGVFQLAITRQLNLSGETQPYQLALIWNYQSTGPLQQIDFGNQWCRSPGDLPAFRKFIEASPAFHALADTPTEHVEFTFQRRG